MSESRGFAVYARLPVWAQNLACSLAGVSMRRSRYNRLFRQSLRFLEQSQWWSLAEQKNYQDEQLRKTIEHAYENVPYYRELFDGLRLRPQDIRGAEDLPKLPLLNKRIVRERYADLQARGWPARRKVINHTGGTTGTALQLVADVDTQPWQWAVWWRHRGRFGLSPRNPFIVFAGRSVVPMSRLDPPFWRRNWPMHQTYVSVHHMTRQNMDALVAYLQTRDVPFYSGYPSALYLLAGYLLNRNIRLRRPPRVIVTGAETVLPHQRRVIEQGIGGQVADQYGASEQCGNMSECEHHLYHVDTEFGVMELVESDRLPGGCRRIVCTSLRNPAMPLIRYDIGDMAQLHEGPCPCGRQSPAVARIDGRIESYILTPDGRQLGRLDFLFKNSPHIVEAQLVQDALDHVRMRVVQTPEYCQADQADLLELARHYLGDAIRIDVEPLAEIPREANGKFRQIVSSLSVGAMSSPAACSGISSLCPEPEGPRE